MKKQHLRRNSLVIVCCMLLTGQSLLSQTIEDWYVNMPDILNPTLSRQNRLELIEYHKAHQSDSVTNRFGNQAHLLTLDSLNNRIVVKNTSSSIFEMKIFQLEDSSTVMGVIRTVCAPVCLSNVELYDTAWNLIPLQFTMPKAIGWVDEKNVSIDKVDGQWLKNTMEVSFVSLAFSDKGQLIVAKNNTLDFLSEADRKIVSPFVIDKPILFKLKGRVWIREL
jgi:hypothetical protein